MIFIKPSNKKNKTKGGGNANKNKKHNNPNATTTNKNNTKTNAYAPANNSLIEKVYVYMGHGSVLVDNEELVKDIVPSNCTYSTIANV